jgi:hypothetical protein
MTTNERTVGRYLRWLLAALSVGAGVIHFAVSGGHFDVGWTHGAFFAVVAWLQLAWAVGVILRPTRRLLAAGVALTPSFASDHHGSGEAAGGHGHGGSGHSAASMKGGGAAHADGHAGGSTEAVIQADGTSACEQAGVANAGNSGHGHRGPVPFTPMDAATRDAQASQIAISNAFVQAHPTVKEAEADGYRKITPYVPCIAAHYIKGGALANPFDPAEPEIVLYDGTDPDSKIVGLSYLQFAGKDAPPPGFAGENDPWHVHEQLCLGGGGVLGDESTTEEECAARGGKIQKLGNLWMTHMWNVAGWESRWGLFSSEHPDLGGTIGNLNAAPEEVAAARAKAEAEKKAKESS